MPGVRCKAFGRLDLVKWLRTLAVDNHSAIAGRKKLRSKTVVGMDAATTPRRGCSWLFTSDLVFPAVLEACR